MRNVYTLTIVLIIPLFACDLRNRTKTTSEKDGITVAAYYFPNYHEDKRNAAYHGAGWTEWELVKNARPRFANHHQPNVPAWG